MAVIGIDLGGTKITGALFDKDGTKRAKVACLLEKREGREVGQLVLEMIDKLIEKPGCQEDVVRAVGICVPGIADCKTGLIWAPNIKGWESYPLQKEVEARMNEHQIKVTVGSDRTCYILGEKWKGVAQDTENAVFISVGTGIGAGLLVDGNIVHGSGDIVGAIGWFAMGTSFKDEYKRCGCLESYASGDGIARQARKILTEGIQFQDSLLREIRPACLSSKDVFEAFYKRDALAVSIVEKAIDLWAMASANLVSLLNPEIVIWGGGVFGPAAQLIDRIYERAKQWAQSIAIKQTRFEKSALQGNAGLYGAGYLALSSIINNGVK